MNVEPPKDTMPSVAAPLRIVPHDDPEIDNPAMCTLSVYSLRPEPLKRPSSPDVTRFSRLT